VGIVGEIYVRNNVFANEDVISAVELFGGEAWMIPITDWILYTSSSPFLDDRHEPPFQECMNLATPYIAFYCGGEGKLSIGRAIKFAQQGAAIVVNCAPFACMPETVATSVFGRVSADVDTPIVSMFDDGNGGQNRRLEVFLNNAVSGKRQSGHTQIGGGDFQPGWSGKDRLVDGRFPDQEKQASICLGTAGPRRDLPPRHQVGSWYPVILVKVVPSDAAGDKEQT
jgi:predicted nucleotide-binding protein (sugar kinase/HSP70/actin superfamily)